jgi:CRISPR/Cas system CSM-associated protein Csm2 small subunit
MILAAVHHLKYKENKAIAFNAILFLLAAFVAYGRFTSL